MLAQKSYPSAYVAASRQMIRDQVSAYEALGLDAAQRASFEPTYARTLLLCLDHLFTHRMRGQEGKKVLHQVRGLCDQIRDGLVPETAPELSVAEVADLAEAFLDEIAERFPEAVPA